MEELTLLKCHLHVYGLSERNQDRIIQYMTCNFEKEGSDLSTSLSSICAERLPSLFDFLKPSPPQP